MNIKEKTLNIYIAPIYVYFIFHAKLVPEMTDKYEMFKSF